MTEPRKSTVPVAVERAYDLWLWLDAHAMNLPAHTRAALGARLLDTALDLLDTLLKTSYEPRGSTARPTLLRHANQRVALLRYLLRGLRDRKHISHEQHAHAVERVDTIGRMVGAWAKGVA